MSLTSVPRSDPALLDALRADLTEAEYTVPAVEELLGPLASAALHREEPLPALRATAGPGDPTTARVAALVRLFVLGAEVPRRAVEAAFPRLGADGVARLGLVEVAGAQDGDAVRAVVDLRPYEAADAAGTVDWWLASDLGELATGRALHTDHVLGVGGASTTLAQVTVRDPRDRVLDLGTGCGIQALHASRHARQVVGTDISVRALAFARFNASLAGLSAERLELRAGSMLEPVAGELFDLVVSNPPFVITPRAAGVPEYDYRDGGLAGDAIVRELVTGVGRVLAPGGVALLSKGKRKTPLLITLADQKIASVPWYTRLLLKYVLGQADQIFAMDTYEAQSVLTVSKRTALIKSIGRGDAFANQIRFAYANFLRKRIKKV